MPEIGRLRAGEHDVGRLQRGDTCQHAGHCHGVGVPQAFVPHPDAAVRALGERSAQGLLGIVRADGDGDHLACVELLGQQQRFLQRRFVPLVQLVLEVLVIDRAVGLVNRELRVQLADPLDRDEHAGAVLRRHLVGRQGRRTDRGRAPRAGGGRRLGRRLRFMLGR